MNVRWKLRRGSSRQVVELHGDLDETADFGDLASALEGRVTIDLGAVRRINSAGVREWIEFVRNLPEVTELTLVGCSKVSVVQLNLIQNFCGPARVRSFWAPYVCGFCKAERQVLLEAQESDWVERALGTRVPAAPRVPCEKCGTRMELDELPDSYFLFLADRPIRLGVGAGAGNLAARQARSS